MSLFAVILQFHFIGIKKPRLLEAGDIHKISSQSSYSSIQTGTGKFDSPFYIVLLVWKYVSIGDLNLPLEDT